MKSFVINSFRQEIELFLDTNYLLAGIRKYLDMILIQMHYGPWIADKVIEIWCILISCN